MLTAFATPAVRIICAKCNDRVEKEKPWLYERRAPDPEYHNWSHTLVWVPADPAPGEQEDWAALSTEERLQRLEAIIREHIEATGTRHGTLEQLLGEVLTQLGREP